MKCVSFFAEAVLLRFQQRGFLKANHIRKPRTGGEILHLWLTRFVGLDCP